MGKPADEIPDQSKKALIEATEAYRDKLKVMEKHLKKEESQFLVGDSISLADIVLCSETWDWWYMRKMEIVSKMPHVRAWFFRCM